MMILKTKCIHVGKNLHAALEKDYLVFQLDVVPPVQLAKAMVYVLTKNQMNKMIEVWDMLWDWFQA